MNGGELSKQHWTELDEMLAVSAADQAIIHARIARGFQLVIEYQLVDHEVQDCETCDEDDCAIPSHVQMYKAEEDAPEVAPEMVHNISLIKLLSYIQVGWNCSSLSEQAQFACVIALRHMPKNMQSWTTFIDDKPPVS